MPDRDRIARPGGVRHARTRAGTRRVSGPKRNRGAADAAPRAPRPASTRSWSKIRRSPSDRRGTDWLSASGRCLLAPSGPATPNHRCARTPRPRRSGRRAVLAVVRI